uniref:Leucoanthocyanidin reductase n=1 Tax=Aegilops tauschii TaxID=37682 RepID=M8C0I9_AEGTA
MAPAEGNVSRKTACVTGGSGYIASALVKMLLEKGYAVKTTARNPDDAEKTAHLKALAALGPLEVFRADLNEEGSFDDAVAGCDYAFLVAAPVTLLPENPEVEEVIQPAIQGTLNVMRSCVKAGTVKRVVLTSSTAAISSRPLEGDGHVLDEESWSDVEYLRANKIGTWAYPASKVLAEKATMAFAEEKGLSLVTVCPVVVVGRAPATKVTTSVPEILSLISGDDDMVDRLELIEQASGSIPLVHIEDVCRAEIFAAEEATSGRDIVCTLNTSGVALAHFLAAKYPQYEINTDHIGGLPEKPRVCIWSDKLVKEGFQYKYNNLDEIYDDVVVYGRALGVLPY